MKQFTLDTAEVSADIAAKAKSNKDRAEMIRVIQQINSARADEKYRVNLGILLRPATITALEAKNYRVLKDRSMTGYGNQTQDTHDIRWNKLAST